VDNTNKEIRKRLELLAADELLGGALRRNLFFRSNYFMAQSRLYPWGRGIDITKEI